MTALAIILLFIILYVYFGYFALVGTLALFFNRKVKKRPITPSVTLMIAAYNEEKGIEDKILNSLELEYPKDKLEIVVVSDASSDNTDTIVRRYEERGVKLIRVEGRVGKTEARNVAMRNVASEIVLFSDGTTVYEPDLVTKLVANFADPEVGMVTGHLRYRDPGGQMGGGQKLYWIYESIIKKCQTRLGTLTGSVGCVTAFRREAYTELPPEIIEDFTEPLMFILKGYRVVFEADAKCYELATSKSSQEWSMRVRVVRGGLAGLWHARALLNPFKYPVASFQLVSHKLMRWFVPVFAIALLNVSFLAAMGDFSLTQKGILFPQLFFYMAVLGGMYLEKNGVHSKLLGIPQYLFIVNAASLTAIYKALTSPLQATWETDR